MKGRFGSTEYFVVTMRAKELAEKLVIPKDLQDWEELTIEERFQREINYSRVKKHIAPYLANDEDRFFGAFIVDIYNDEGVEFESIESIAKGLPSLYKKAAVSLGMLNFDGNEILVPLDGQHRLAAIRFAISGKDEKGKDIAGFDPNMDIGNDWCTVIMLKHDTKKARKIFNKVNRYAKSTSKADNLITADDDIIAIITREELADKLIHERIVNYSSNTLSKTTHFFSTLATLYDTTTLILEELHGKIDITVLPSSAIRSVYRTEVVDFWSEICDRIELISKAIDDPTETGDTKRIEIRSDYILGKPIAQKTLIDSILRLRGEDAKGERMSWDEVAHRVNVTDWRVSNPVWQGILMQGDKMMAGKQVSKFAARFIEYYLGGALKVKEVETLAEQYKASTNKNKLPDPMVF